MYRRVTAQINKYDDERQPPVNNRLGIIDGDEHQRKEGNRSPTTTSNYDNDVRGTTTTTTTVTNNTEAAAVE